MRRVVGPDDALAAALRPWERQLVLEAIRRWAIRGAIAALVAGCLVLLVGWITPWPETELRPWAAKLALPLLLAALVVAIWPVKRIWRAAELDARLGLGDRLATAWALRDSRQSIALLQRSDAIARLSSHSARRTLTRGGRPSRLELGVLAAVCLVGLILLFIPSPQQPVLDQRAAEQLAVQQAAERLEVLRQEATSAPSLTPEQARQLDELLRQAQAQMAGVKTQHEATAILARAEDQLGQQLADPNADARDQALAAMSETLAAEPLTKSLGDALQHEDAQAASNAIKSLTQQADQLSDVQRSALSRALLRASNVGRSDPRSASALRDAASAVGSGENPTAALASTETALNDAIQSATAQNNLRETSQRLRDLETQLASGAPLRGDPSQASGANARLPNGSTYGMGTPVALDAGGGRLTDPSAGPGGGAGVGAADLALQGQAPPVIQAAENVFVAGRPGNGPADQNLTDQPFTVRGEPRPYREVLGQYAQSGRDYVDRPDVSPAVRDLVKQYFQQLEEGQ